jgi:hypothetical protein
MNTNLGALVDLPAQETFGRAEIFSAHLIRQMKIKAALPDLRGRLPGSWPCRATTGCRARWTSADRPAAHDRSENQPAVEARAGPRINCRTSAAG